MRQLNDFEVPECVGHFYNKDGMWFWHCMTCNTGSGKRRKHLHGHKRDGDAAVALKYHCNAKRVQRQQELYRAWWWREIMTTSDLDHFMALWNCDHFWASHQPDDPSDLMSTIQSDNDLWNYMIKLNPGERKK